MSIIYSFVCHKCKEYQPVAQAPSFYFWTDPKDLAATRDFVRTHLHCSDKPPEFLREGWDGDLDYRASPTGDEESNP